jgi:YesN/AraC family two-component response regulator
MNGNREFFIKDRTFLIQEGDVIIIAPNIVHRTTNSALPKHERLIVNIPKDDLTAINTSYLEIMHPLFEQEYMIVRSPFQEQVFVEGIARNILQEMQEKKPGFEIYAQTLVLQLLIYCCRHVKQHVSEPLEFPSPMHERISRVAGYINSHYMDELSLQLLAERFYVSPYYLSRSFKEATGFAFVEYLNMVRVKESKKLLEETKLKVNLIAERVGFGSVTHFGRVFKAVTGHPPLFFRKASK